MNAGMRLLVYITRRIAVILLIVFLITVAFSIGYDLANAYVVLNEGFTQRAAVAFNQQDIMAMNNYFTHNYITTDPLLIANKYSNFVIKDYDQRVKVKWLWTWPWQSTAKMEVEEDIFNISGEMIDSNSDDQEAKQVAIPQWSNGKKIVVMKKNDRRWKIDQIIVKNE